MACLTVSLSYINPYDTNCENDYTFWNETGTHIFTHQVMHICLSEPGNGLLATQPHNQDKEPLFFIKIFCSIFSHHIKSTQQKQIPLITDWPSRQQQSSAIETIHTDEP